MDFSTKNYSSQIKLDIKRILQVFLPQLPSHSIDIISNTISNSHQNYHKKLHHTFIIKGNCDILHSYQSKYHQNYIHQIFHFTE